MADKKKDVEKEDKKKRTTVYLTEKEKKLLTDVAYWERTTQADLLTEILIPELEKRLEKYKEEIEKRKNK